MVSSLKQKWPKLYNSPIHLTFWDILNDGMEILNGDYEELILNIKDVMDTKGNLHLVSISRGIFSFLLPSVHKN